MDGPEFDGHLVDFDLLTSRLGAYKEEEGESRKFFARIADGYSHPCKEEA